MRRHVPTRQGLAIAGGILLLAMWYGGTLWGTDRGIRNIEAQATTTAPPAPHAREPWRAMRFFGDPDAYHWLSFARDLRASGHLRVRYTFADNTPYGRDVHWAQLPIWSLAGLSFAIERAAGLSPPRALEWAGRLLMPLAGFLFCSALLWMASRWVHPLMGWLLAFPIAFSSLLDFHTLRPDHHGFQIAFACCSLLGLLCSGMGWHRPCHPARADDSPLLPPLVPARRRLVASGLFAGMALWMGATVFTFLLAAIAAGTALALIRSSTNDVPDDVVLQPNLFRWWGGAGAAASLFFYLIEYAPSHFSMRLEVNHPLYALCFLGTAECLRALARWKQGRSAFGLRDGLFAATGFLAAGILPLLVLFGPVAWYIPRSPLMLRLHKRFIIEFLPLWQQLSGQLLLDHATLLLLGGATLGLTGWLVKGRRLPFADRAPLHLLAVVSVWVFALFLWQSRWVQFVAPILVLFAGFCLLAAWRSRPPSQGPLRLPWLPILLGLLLLAQTVHAAHVALRPIRRMLRVESMDPLWFKYLLQRNVMLNLKATALDTPRRLILPAEMAPAAYYFGLGPGVASLYWENLDGLNATAEFLGDPLPGLHANEIARERGLTHVLLTYEPHDAFMFYHLLTGDTNRAAVPDTVGGALSNPQASLLPNWVRLDYRLSLEASRSIAIFIPATAQWVPFNLPIHFYAVQQDAAARPPPSPS